MFLFCTVKYEVNMGTLQPTFKTAFLIYCNHLNNNDFHNKEIIELYNYHNFMELRLCMKMPVAI